MEKDLHVLGGVWIGALGITSSCDTHSTMEKSPVMHGKYEGFELCTKLSKLVLLSLWPQDGEAHSFLHRKPSTIHRYWSLRNCNLRIASFRVLLVGRIEHLASLEAEDPGRDAVHQRGYLGNALHVENTALILCHQIKGHRWLQSKSHVEINLASMYLSTPLIRGC